MYGPDLACRGGVAPAAAGCLMNWGTGLRVLRCGMVSDRRTGWLAVQRMNPRHAFMIPPRGSRLTKRSSTSMPNVNSRRARPRFAFSPRSRNRRDYPASRSPGCGRVLPAPPTHAPPQNGIDRYLRACAGLPISPGGQSSSMDDRRSACESRAARTDAKGRHQRARCVDSRR